MKIIKHLPNTLTCCNLLSGCISIALLFNGNLMGAGVMIFIAALFDFFDGFAARLLNAHSPIGGELDSLSDVISFGVAPSFIVYRLLSESSLSLIVNNINIIPFAAFLMAAFASIRLAKFNIDPEQKSSFVGLPTPATGIFFASIAIGITQTETDSILHIINSPLPLLASILIFSFLMVSKIPFFSFKIKNFSFKDNSLRYTVIMIAIIIFVLLKWQSLPFIILFYILLSFCFYKEEKDKKQSDA